MRTCTLVPHTCAHTHTHSVTIKGTVNETPPTKPPVKVHSPSSHWLLSSLASTAATSASPCGKSHHRHHQDVFPVPLQVPACVPHVPLALSSSGAPCASHPQARPCCCLHFCNCHPLAPAPTPARLAEPL